MKIARILIALLLTTTALAQAPGENRVEGYVRAFNTGNAAELETFLQENLTPQMLQRRTADERRAMYQQIWSAHGKLEIVNVRTTNDGLTIDTKAERGGPLQLRFVIEPAAPHRIAGMAIEVGGGREDGPSLPPLKLPKTDYSAALDAYIRQLPEFSGTVLVAKNGAVQFEKAYGLASRRNNVANQTSTRYNVGSITKAFTKTAIGQLVQAGKLKLDAPISTYLPNYPNKDVAQKITVQQLLDHTSGLGDIFTPRYLESGQELRSVQSYIDFYAADPLLFEPGKGRRYSNYGYVVLGAIVEAVSGQDYFEYIRKNVFEPAGMSASGFDWTKGGANLAEGHSQRPAPRVRNHGVPAGGSYSTARDLLQFDRALRGGKLLNPEQTRWFFRGDIQGSYSAAGGAPGVNAVLSSDGEWTVVVLTNIDPPTGEKLGETIFDALPR